MSKTGTRVETGYRESVNKTGCYEPKIPAEYAQPLIEYCRKENVKKLDFLCEAIKFYLDYLKIGERGTGFYFGINCDLAFRFSAYCEKAKLDPSAVLTELVEKYMREKINSTMHMLKTCSESVHPIRDVMDDLICDLGTLLGVDLEDEE